MQKLTKEQIDALKARAAADKAQADADAIENDARRVAELNRLGVAYNKLIPVIFAEIEKGVKIKNDGRLYSNDKARIDAVLADNLLAPCRVSLTYKYIQHGDQWRGSWSLELGGYYNEAGPVRGSFEPRTVPVYVAGYLWINDTGVPVALDNIKRMKTDRTVEAVTAARVELVEVEKQIATLQAKNNSLQGVISC
jgi:hypothetical protein